MSVLLSVLLIIVGFIFLIKGANLLVDGSSNVAKKFHIPEIIIGLTIVSIGTSMPELFVSLTSALEGFPDMSVGNVVGSNVANLLLILGMSAIINSLKFKRETRLIEIPICLVVTILFMILANLGRDITRVDAIILLVAFVAFIIYTIVMAKKGEEFDKEDEVEVQKEETKTTSTLRDVVSIILGIVLLKIGGDFTVDNAVNIANFYNWSEKLISVTILAVGTSLPELVTSVSAAFKGNSDIAIGNILGSNIFNMLFIIGISALISPITYNISYNKDLVILLIATVVLALFPIIPPKNKMSRMNGVVYCALYIGYLAMLFVS